MDMLPLSFCENEGFKKCMQIVEPAYKVPTRHTLEKRIEIIGKDLQTNVTAELEKAESIAFTSDGWTSLTVVPYETVTGHFINKKWEAICVTLSTECMEESHTGEILQREFVMSLPIWILRIKLWAWCTIMRQTWRLLHAFLS